MSKILIYLLLILRYFIIIFLFFPFIIYSKKRFKLPIPIIIAAFTLFSLEFATIKNKKRQEKERIMTEVIEELKAELEKEEAKARERFYQIIKEIENERK